MVHHSEITEIKIVDEKGEVSFQKVEAYNNESIRIGNNVILKDDKSLNVLDYKDYIISFDDIQFSTTNEETIKNKMYSVYEKLKNIEFSDIRTERFVIIKEREKNNQGNYIIDRSKGEINFEKEMKFPKDKNGKDIKIRGADGEYKKEWTGKYTLTKQYTRAKENLNGAFFSLHLNEKTHPHVHVWIPKTVKMGYKYEAFRSAVRDVAKSEGLILQEDTKYFSKDELKIEKESKNLNDYRTARQVLSSYSYILEEYKSLNDEKKQAFKEKFFKKDIINCRRYKISVKNDEHIEITNKRDKKQKVYSLDKLLEVYTNTKVGSQDFINQLISRHNALTSYSKKDITKYTFSYELEAQKTYEKNGVKGIVELLQKKVGSGEKIPNRIKDIWRGLANSTSANDREIAEQITEIYQSRATKYTEIDTERIEKAKVNIEKIKKKYEKMELQEKVLVRFEELLKVETEKESNIINSLKHEFGLETLYVDKQDKTVLCFGAKDYEKVSIKHLLEDKSTVYQVIVENKNKKQVKLFASEMQVAIEETTNRIGGLVAKDTIQEIMKNKPFFYLVPLKTELTDEAHEKKLNENVKKLSFFKELSIENIKKEFSFEYVNKISVIEPARFSKTIINSILSACKNVFGFAVEIAKNFYSTIMQKSEVYQERLRIGNEIIGGKETDINKVKEEIEKVDRDYRERDERSSGRHER